MVNFSLMPKPIIAFDMDGTLLDNDGQLRPQDKKILMNCQDAVFIVASGRQRFSIRKTFVDNGMYEDAPLPFPLAMANGGAIYRGGEELIEASAFEPEMQETLLKAAEGLDGIPYLVHGVDCLMAPHPSPLTQEMVAYYGMTLLPFTLNARQSPLIKFLFWSLDPADLEKANDAVRELPVATCYSSPVLFEINPLGVNKGEALRRLQKHLGMEDLLLFTAGDGGNDAEMLKAATISFAPLSASPEVKALADEVIDTDKDGLLGPMLERALKF